MLRSVRFGLKYIETIDRVVLLRGCISRDELFWIVWFCFDLSHHSWCTNWMVHFHWIVHFLSLLFCLSIALTPFCWVIPSTKGANGDAKWCNLRFSRFCTNCLWIKLQASLKMHSKSSKICGFVGFRKKLKNLRFFRLS